MALTYKNKTYKTINTFNNAIKKDKAQAYRNAQNEYFKTKTRYESKIELSERRQQKLKDRENLYKRLYKDFSDFYDADNKRRKDEARDKRMTKKQIQQSYREELLNFEVQNLRNNKTKFTTDERLKRKGLRTINELVYGDKVAYTKALNGAFKSVRLENHAKLPKFQWIDRTKNLLNNEWSIRDKTKGMLVYIVIEVMCSKIIQHSDGTKEIIKFSNWYHSKQRHILSGSNEEFMRLLRKINEEMYEEIEGPSGVVIDYIAYVDIRISKTKPVAVGGSYIELPNVIKNKQACINIKNNDDRCFEWCLIGYFVMRDNLLGKSSKSEVRRYKKFTNLIKIPDNQTYPVNHIEAQNYAKLNNIKINVFELDENNITTSLSNDMNDRNKDVCNILLIHNEDKTKSHYVLIQKLDPLLPKYDNHHEYKHTCPQCLSKSFSTKALLEAHVKLCMNHESVKVEMPTKGGKINKNGVSNHDDILKFKNYNHIFKHPYFITADFESTLKNVNKEKEEEEQKGEKTFIDVNIINDKNNFDKVKVDSSKAKSTKYQKHVANSFGIKYNCIHNEHSEKKIIINNSNEEVVIESFVLELERLAKKSYDLTKNNIKNIIYKNEEERKNHFKCKECMLCKCKFDNNKNFRVAHHDHISGEFLGSLCNGCNLDLKYKKFIPVIIHNLKNYDAHLFVSGLAAYGFKNHDMSNIQCVPNNEEKYISLSKKIKVDSYIKDGVEVPIMFEIRFIDSIAFMATSLDELVKNLRSGNEDNIEELRKIFKYTSEEYVNDEKFMSMIHKGIYPYDWFNDYTKMNQTELPTMKQFYSKLTNTEISIESYITAKKVWKLFNCQTFKDYHNIYLTSDVLLLSDVWSNFVDTCYSYYNIDPNYYITAPSLSWDAMLKFGYKKNEDDKFLTPHEIELLTDYDMHLFFENSIRGGVSQISHRYSEANNKYMSNYDKLKEDKYILYEDANNLYSVAMIQYLPYKNFKWNTDEWTEEKILSLGDEDKKGYTFEVDLEYPKELHDLHNQYPLCPESRSVKKSDLNLWQQYEYKESKVKKLILSLEDKLNYGVHYRYLKLALQLGMKLKKVHRCVEYEQAPLMREYINFNTELRKKAKNDFEKDFFKLLCNACFGKTLEDVRSRCLFNLINQENTLYNLRNDVKKFTIFNENLVGVYQHKRTVKLCKPIFIGQAILDSSKIVMYDFHYNFMLKNIKKENLNLLFTDTDSLCYEIKNTDIYEIMKNNLDKFDTGNYAKNHPLYSYKNNKVLGKMKDESAGIPITHFVGLRSKVYSYKVEGDDKKNKNHNKLKGVKKYITGNIKFEMYKDTLFNREIETFKQNSIRSYQHNIYTESTIKTGLSYADDKIFICSDNINCYNAGHKNIKIVQLFEELAF